MEGPREGWIEVSGIPSSVLSAFSHATKSVASVVGDGRLTGARADSIWARGGAWPTLQFGIRDI